jgi:beta-glucosidase
VRLEDTPTYLSFPGENNVANYREGIFVGYRYYDKKRIKPLFDFGHGLSYTRFEYSKLQLNTKKLAENGKLEICVNIKNTGDYSGKEAVQLYIGRKDSKVIRPVKELQAFEKVSLEPGEEKTVRFELCKGDFAYYNAAVPGWITEPGEYRIFIGNSSADIRQKVRIEVESKDRVLLPITRNTAFGDVFDIPELNDIFLPFFDTLVANIPLEFNLGDKNGQLAKAMLRVMTFSSIAAYEGKAASDEFMEDFLKRMNDRLDALFR